MLRLILIAALIVVAVVVLRRLFGHRPIEPFSRQPPPKLIPKDGGTVTAEIDGQELEIDAAVLDEMRRLVAAGQKIEAIKHLREATGLGLTEAKQIVDSLDQLKK